MRECVFLVLLDLSATFNTVDQGKMKQRLGEELGAAGEALKWLDSYMNDRKQVVSVRAVVSDEKILQYGVL